MTNSLLRTTACCGIFLVLSGCSLFSTSSSSAPAEQDILTAREQKQHLPIVSLYASLTCMVADDGFATREGYVDIESIYADHGHNTVSAQQSMRLHILQSGIPELLIKAIDDYCPGKVPDEKKAQIAEQLRRNAL